MMSATISATPLLLGWVVNFFLKLVKLWILTNRILVSEIPKIEMLSWSMKIFST
jgi:hypothetical protein